MDETKEKLTRFYNKFNENKRLDTRHGQVEFFTSIKYIHDYLKPGDRIADIGAGPGKYSLFLKQEGYDVTAVELVRPNIGMLRAKDKEIRIIEADARDLHMLKDREFDAVILFGPMYHLYSFEDRLQALKEAARICKRVLFVTYIMNEYALSPSKLPAIYGVSLYAEANGTTLPSAFSDAMSSRYVRSSSVVNLEDKIPESGM